MLTQTVGRGLVVNHKHDDYASTALTLVKVTNTTRLLGGEKNTNVKIHVQVHFTIASQFYVYVNVELFIHTFMCWKKRRSSKELSNNINDRSEA